MDIFSPKLTPETLHRFSEQGFPAQAAADVAECFLDSSDPRVRHEAAKIILLHDSKWMRQRLARYLSSGDLCPMELSEKFAIAYALGSKYGVDFSPRNAAHELDEEEVTLVTISRAAKWCLRSTPP